MTETASDEAVNWLAAAAVDPRTCVREWELSDCGTALLPAGRLWDVLIVPRQLGQAALDVMLRIPGHRPGPTLVDFHAHRVGFFIPPAAGRCWVGSRMRCAGTGSWIAVPKPLWCPGGIRWLVPPDGSGTLHSLDVLELALHEAAAKEAAPFPGAAPAVDCPTGEGPLRPYPSVP
jgi:hypothetical protein